MNRLDPHRLGSHEELLDRFCSMRAVVVGEAMLDVYVSGSVERLCPEGPFPVVDATDRREVLGGAANVAANLAGLGASVDLVTVVGDDAAGESLLSLAAESGIETRYSVSQPGRMTIAKLRVVGDGRPLVRIDEGSTDAVLGSAAEALLAGMSGAIDDVDVVVVSDYRYGVVGDGLIDWLGEAVRAPVVVDSKDLRRFSGLRPRVVTSNYSEVVALVDGIRRDENRIDHIQRTATSLLPATGAATVAVTLDIDGVVVATRTARLCTSRPAPWRPTRAEPATPSPPQWRSESPPEGPPSRRRHWPAGPRPSSCPVEGRPCAVCPISESGDPTSGSPTSRRSSSSWGADGAQARQSSSRTGASTSSTPDTSLHSTKPPVWATSSWSA